ncbi:hypothetical protein [Galbibacter sp. PAP.153]|uniref:hypothetical protein n=1 Tax=Galbibacter sp. PAP.153 TaxID=3104623 RepID=UPI0030098284
MDAFIGISIIAFLTFFFLKWILKKLKVGSKNSRNSMAIFSALIASPFIYFGIIFLWMFSASYYPSEEFYKKEWDTHVEERYKMSKHIIESQMLIGKTKAEITVLLGKEFYTYNENHIAYTLGFVPGLFNIDPDVLDVIFKNGKVIEVAQHES